MISFHEMAHKKKLLYECMWGSRQFDFPIEKSIYKGSVTNNSYSFSNTSTTDADICMNRLADVFGIVNRELFDKKFRQVISGSGQELRRISTVHSSSLCGMLFFYNVTEQHPYYVTIEGEDYCFTYSCFEYQNKVIEGRNPSNMDVVLVGTHVITGRPVVFFLESKFSEYYERAGMKLNVAKEYLNNRFSKEIYRSITELGLALTYEAGEKEFELSSGKSMYIEGIKQMISHYVGVRNFYEQPSEKDPVVYKAVQSDAMILLGEILFTKGIGELVLEGGESCLDSYKEKYSTLAQTLNGVLQKDGQKGNIRVLQEIMTYSQFEGKPFIQEDSIQKFYFRLGKEEKQ